MFMRVADLVFLLLIRLCFPHSNFVTEVIRKRYGQNTVKKFRKLEKLDYRLRKDHLDIVLLVNCSNSFLVPKFLNFRAPTKPLKSSITYHQCQLSLLHEKIGQKYLI